MSGTDDTRAAQTAPDRRAWLTAIDSKDYFFLAHTLHKGVTALGRVHQPSEEKTMFGWAITFLIVAIIAGIFGFAGVAGTAAWIAKILFVVGLAVFLVMLVMGRQPPAA
jgi:uncharacterized membrane protein YtjA (UPF0391 family)